MNALSSTSWTIGKMRDVDMNTKSATQSQRAKMCVPCVFARNRIDPSVLPFWYLKLPVPQFVIEQHKTKKNWFLTSLCLSLSGLPVSIIDSRLASCQCGVGRGKERHLALNYRESLASRHMPRYQSRPPRAIPQPHFIPLALSVLLCARGKAENVCTWAPAINSRF